MITKTQDIKQVRVKNIDGRSQQNCNCDNWLQHWLNNSREHAFTCRAKGCVNTNVKGMHVQKDASYDRNRYIVPLCEMHSEQKETLELKEGTCLVSAHKSLTCGIIHYDI